MLGAKKRDTFLNVFAKMYGCGSKRKLCCCRNLRSPKIDRVFLIAWAKTIFAMLAAPHDPRCVPLPRTPAHGLQGPPGRGHRFNCVCAYTYFYVHTNVDFCGRSGSLGGPKLGCLLKGWWGYPSCMDPPLFGRPPEPLNSIRI